AVVAHRLDGTRLGHAGEGGLELAGAEAAPGLELVAGAAAHGGVEEAPPELLRIDDRYVRGGDGAARDAGLDLAQRDLVADRDDGVEAGTAGPLQGDARRLRRQPRGQRRLATQVPVRGMLDHRAHGDLAQALAMQPEALHQRPQGADGHAQVADVGIGGVVAAERDADPAQDADRARKALLAHRAGDSSGMPGTAGRIIACRPRASQAGGGKRDTAAAECSTVRARDAQGRPDMTDTDTLFQGAVALELRPGARPERVQLARDAAGRIADGVANDLARLLPESSALDLALAAALFDPAELLRPGWPVHGALAALA